MLEHRCFIVNVAKRLRTAFLKKTSSGCFCRFDKVTVHHRASDMEINRLLHWIVLYLIELNCSGLYWMELHYVSCPMVCKIFLAPNSPIFRKIFSKEEAEEGEKGNRKALCFSSKCKKHPLLAVDWSTVESLQIYMNLSKGSFTLEIHTLGYVFCTTEGSLVF